MTKNRINHAMTSAEWGLLVLLSVLWGGSFFFNRVAVMEISPLTLVTVRVSGAALALLIVLRARGLRLPPAGKIWLAFFIMGFLNNALPFTLICWGQKSIVSGLAAILNATTPFFTIFIAHYFSRDETITLNRLAGIGVGFVGVVWLIGPQVLSATGSDALAQAACLIAALSYGCAAVFGRRFGGMGLQPLEVATGQLTASSLMMLPMVVMVNGVSTPHLSLAAFSALAGIALLSTALAYILYFRLLATVGATNLQLVTLLIPLSAIVLSAAFLGERLETDHIIAAAFIGAGLMLIDGRLLSLARRVTH